MAQITREELARIEDRVGSFLVDSVLGMIPFVGFVVQLVNLTMFRRGRTVGLRMAGARVVRENGEVAGFFHTYVRGSAAVLSAIPLGLGYWWALRDPLRQTWHDKLLRTYVVRDTEELAFRAGTSSSAARVWFWPILALSVVFGVVVGIALAT